MQQTDTQEKSEVSDSHKRLCAAFGAVFGLDEARRSPAQRVVWAHLEHMGYMKRPTLVPGVGGKCDPLRLAHADGSRFVTLQIQAFIDAEKRLQSENTSNKPKVKK
jgi:hypothetical protein